MPTEDTWTAPRPDCLHPERWHATDSDSAEHEVSELVATFVRALQPDVVVETGSAFGQTAAVICSALQTNGHGHLYTIEPDPHRCEATRTRLRHWDYFGLVTLVEGSSLDFTPPDGIGFCWFDSLIGLRVPEFHRYRPHMAPGCVVGFHDTGPQHQLRPALDELEASGAVRIIYLPTPRGVAFAEVL